MKVSAQHAAAVYMPMQIGNIQLSNPVILAPLAGITNLPFRRIAKAAGCGLVCSEMISANGLYHGSQKTRAMLASHPAEAPLAVQLFGADPDITAAAAEMVAEAGAHILDINFGCAVKKIVKTGSGVALMKEPRRAQRLLKAVRRAVAIPLTIKIRSGWDASGDQALEIARIAQDCGVDAISVHPRTASQGFRGEADWTLIGRVKAALTLPVIGNGDIQTPGDALAMRRQTACDGIMIGRAAIGNPLLLGQAASALAGTPPPLVTLDERFAIMAQYLKASVDYMGEAIACRLMRSRLGWFVKGLPHNREFRESITHLRTQAEALARIESYRARIQGALSADLHHWHEAPPLQAAAGALR